MLPHGAREACLTAACPATFLPTPAAPRGPDPARKTPCMISPLTVRDAAKASPAAGDDDAADARRGWLRRLTWGLRRRLAIIFAVLTVAFVGTVIQLNVDTQLRLIEQRTELRATYIADLVSGVSMSAMARGDLAELEPFYLGHSQQPDIETIFLLDAEGRLLVSGDAGQQRGMVVADPLAWTALASGTVVTERQGALIRTAAPVRAGDAIAGVLRFDLSRTALLGEVRAVWQSNLVAGLAFVVIGSWLSWLLAGRLTVALDRLTRATRAATAGDLDQKIMLRSNDEFEVLSTSFSAMLDTIQHSMAEIHRVAYEDKLTAIPNRAWLNRQLEVLAAPDSKAGEFAVMFLDLDRFKQVNDTHGHHVGDLLLQVFAGRLNTCMLALGLKPRVVGREDGRAVAIARNEGILARLGGDEFTIVVPTMVAQPLAETIISALDVPITLDGRRLTTSTSIGIALYPEHGRSRESLLKCADIAMYQAKSAGRRTFAYYDHSNFERLQANIDLEEDLNRAIHGDEFELYLQPQFRVSDDEVIGAEALIRWRHPQRGLLSPADFLPVAQAAGLMPIIGQIMLRKTIQATARINRERTTPLILAVNIAIEELDQEGFTDAVARMLKFYGAQADALEIEITEGTAMEENARIVQQVAMLRALGVRLAIDDFGMGYSNLARLKELAFETLKVDRALIEGIGEDAASGTLFLTILEMAEAIEARVVAEGVETEGQRAFLRNSACQSYQGYLGGRPVPADRFEEWIAAHGVADYGCEAVAEAKVA